MDINAVKLKNNLIHWLCAHNAANIEIDYEEDFGYAIGDDDTRCINLGVTRWHEEAVYFEQFLYEYGCEYIDIPIPVLAFLHELGHHFTLSNFTDFELKFYETIKGALSNFTDFELKFCENTKSADTEESDFDFFYHYWELPDEFAANMWVIDFINNNIDDVNELSYIYWNGWKEIKNPLELVEENYYEY